MKPCSAAILMAAFKLYFLCPLPLCLLCCTNSSQLLCLIIQIKAIEQFFLVVLFIMLYKMVISFEFVNEILKCDHSNESYTEQYVPVVLFIMLYKVVLSFEFVNEILKCDHSDESYTEQYVPVVVYYAVLGGSNFGVCG